MRTKNGQTLPSRSVVAADIVAALAGVPYGAAIKTMAALVAISKQYDIPFNTLLNIDNIPFALADDQRWNATDDALHPLVGDIEDKEIRRMLRFNERFNKAA